MSRAIRPVSNRNIESIVVKPTDKKIEIPSGVDLGKKMVVVVNGAGDLIPRFFGPAVEALNERLEANGLQVDTEFWMTGRSQYETDLRRVKGQTARDFFREEREKIDKRMSAAKKRGLEFKRYLPKDQFFAGLANQAFDDDIGVVYNGTPPKFHISDSLPSMEADIVTAVEKPIVVATNGERVLDGAIKNIRKIDKEHPNTLFPIDFFATSEALIWLISNSTGLELFHRLGTINEIQGRCVETFPIEKHRSWLMNPDISGGGLGIDMAVHPLAMLEPIFNLMGLSYNTNTIEVKDAVKGKYHGAPGEPNVESYLWLHAAIRRTNAKDLEIYVDSGKGADDIFYGLKLFGENGTMTIGAGTETHPPFIFLETNDGKKPVRVIFEGGGVGYKDILWNLNLYSRNRDVTLTPSLKALEAGTIGSVDVVGRAYEIAGEKVARFPINHLPKLPKRIKISPDANHSIPKIGEPFNR